MFRRVISSIVALLAGMLPTAAWSADSTTMPAGALALSAPIVVSGLPADATYVVVSCPVDFGQLLAQAKTAGLVDEHSIRLYCTGDGGAETQTPIQYSPAPQARPKSGKLPAGQTGPKQVGILTWAARGSASGEARFRLEFSVPRGGRMVQVSFPPANFRGFAPDGSALPVLQFPTMQLHPQWPVDGVVNMNHGEKLLTAYHIGPTTAPSGEGGIRRPYFFPVFGPDGIALTEFGKPHDPTGSHKHHYSLWIAHHDVGGKNFWEDQGGAIVSDQLELMEDGPVFCRIVQKNKWIFDHVDLMHDRRTLTAYNTPEGFFLLDIDLELTPAGKEPLVLGKTTFGFLAARVAQSMTVFDGGGEILTSAGNRNEAAAHLQHGDWIDQSGPIAPGKWGGISIFDHPTNPNHPTGFHCRNDGWACASFNMEAPFTLTPGKPLNLRYRVLLHSGNATAGEVARRYEEYVATPTVKIGDVTSAK